MSKRIWRERQVVGAVLEEPDAVYPVAEHQVAQLAEPQFAFVQAVHAEHLTVEVAIAVVGHRAVAAFLVAHGTGCKARVVVGSLDLDRGAMLGEFCEARVGLEFAPALLGFVVFAHFEFVHDQRRLDLVHMLLQVARGRADLDHRFALGVGRLERLFVELLGGAHGHQVVEEERRRADDAAGGSLLGDDARVLRAGRVGVTVEGGQHGIGGAFVRLETQPLKFVLFTHLTQCPRDRRDEKRLRDGVVLLADFVVRREVGNDVRRLVA